MRLHKYFSPLCELETKAGRGGVGHITWFRSKCQRNRLGQVSPQINFWAIFNMNSQFETILTLFLFLFWLFSQNIKEMWTIALQKFFVISLWYDWNIFKMNKWGLLSCSRYSLTNSLSFSVNSWIREAMLCAIMK